MTEDIRLRSITYDDTDLIVKWRNSDAVRQHLFSREPITRETHEGWMKSYVETGRCVQFIIEICAENGEWIPVGTSFIKNIDRVHSKAEFGIFIGETLTHDRGYGSKATKMTIDHGFEVLGLHKIYLYVFGNNWIALRVYEKIGFVIEGILKDEYFDGSKYQDILRLVVINKNDH